MEIATILLADRYVFVETGKALPDPKKPNIILDESPKMFSYEKSEDPESIEDSFKRGLDEIAKRYPNLSALTVGSCVAIKSSATFDKITNNAS